MDSAQLVILAGLAIGLVYGVVGLLSGFCLMSSMRGFIAEGDGRLVRTYALAIAVAIAVARQGEAEGLTDGVYADGVEAAVRGKMWMPRYLPYRRAAR